MENVLSLVDYGMKHGILRELNKRDCDVVVVPYNTTAEEILAFHPDGIMLSNGPGDPKDVRSALEMIQESFRKGSALWYLPRTSIICPSKRRKYGKIKIWSSWLKSSCKRFTNRKSSNNLSKPWLCSR